MKLGSLSRLGRLSIEEELAKLRKDQEKYELFIQDEKALRKEAIKELESDKKTYGDARRTIIKVETNTVPDIVENLVLDKTSDENIVIALSEYGWISWKAAKQLNFNESDFKFKAGDSIKKIVVGNRAQTLLLIDNKGKSYSISLNDLSGRTGAEATNKWFKSSNKMIDIILPEDIEKGKYIISSSEGYGFIAKSMDIFTKMTAGKNLINISEQSEVLTAVKVPEVIGEKQVAVILSSENKFVAYPVNNIKELAKGKGVSLMGYSKGEKIISVGITDENGDIKVIDEDKKITTINWKQIQKVMIAERKSTAKGKEINKLKNISGFYFEESDISANIVKRNESQDVAQGE
jgi:topoisomerase-4 subunit A